MAINPTVRWNDGEIPKLRGMGDHLGLGVPKLSCIAYEISCLAFPTDGANCGLMNFLSHWIVGASTN